MILLCLFNAVIYNAKGTNRTEKIIINVVLVVCFSLLMAYRPSFVPDTLSYKQIFDNIKVGESYSFNIFGENERVEYGFLYLVKFYKIFSDNVRFFFFIVCLASVSIFLYGTNRIVTKFMRQKICVPAVMAFYIPYFGIFYNGIAIRQGLAMAMCVLAFSFLIYKKYLRSVLFWFFAFLFHRLSFIFIFIMVAYQILRYFKISSIIYVVVAVICLLIVFLGFGYIINQYTFDFLLNILNKIGLDSAYSDYLANYNNHSFPLNLVFYTFCCLIMVYLARKRRPIKNLINIYIIGIVIMNLLIGSETIWRGTDYFIMFSILIVSCFMTMQGYKVGKSHNRNIIEMRGHTESRVYVLRKQSSLYWALIALMGLGFFLISVNVIFPELIELGI